MQFLLICLQTSIDIFQISCQDISYFLIGYYRFAGRILSIEQHVFINKTSEVLKTSEGWEEKGRVVLENETSEVFKTSEV